MTNSNSRVLGGSRVSHRGRAALSTFSLLAMSWLAFGCAGGARGHLLIVGGGLDEQHAAVWQAFVDACVALPGDGPIYVVPTASGVPGESGPRAVELIERYLGAASHEGTRVEVLPIQHDQPDRAFDTAIVDSIAEARGLWFVGGVQSRIVDVWRPGATDPVDSPALRAVRELLDRGGCVAGTSAGAAIMSDPMIAHGSSADALLGRGGDDGFELAAGLGFFEFGIVDQHFLRRGRLGRLVVALERAERDFGFGVADDSGLLVDRGAARATALGPRSVVVVDRREASRDGEHRRGLRISLLSSGDSVDLRTGEVRFAAVDQVIREPDAMHPSPAPSELAPFGRDTVALLLERLQRGETSAVASDGDFTLRLRRDARSRLDEFEDANGLTAAAVLADIEVHPTPDGDRK